MNIQLVKYKSGLIISCLLFCFGCSSEDMDFDQTSNFKTTPIYKVYLSDFIPKLVVSIPQIPTGGNSKYFPQTIDVFNTTLFDNTVTKAELNFFISNSINSKFTLEIQLNEGLVVFDSFTIEVPAHTGIDFDQNFIRLYLEEQIPSLKKVDLITVKVICEDLNALNSQSITISTRLTAYIKP